VLGAVLTYADESFNTILELGFATSIRREYEWRLARGESTRNLDAFRGWLDRLPDEQPGPGPGAPRRTQDRPDAPPPPD